jgi:hypothetical protein
MLYGHYNVIVKMIILDLYRVWYFSSRCSQLWHCHEILIN